MWRSTLSYEVLARKWRPQTFDEVVGQDHITRTLKRAVQANRISHAYLFAGPRGCGKTSTARILAKVINCTNLKEGNPCNTCDSCVGVTQGKNLDVMEIDGASHTGVGEVRELQESIGYVPSQFANKVYVIDEVHMLSMHAFNALLKTLEEPPAHVYFIFATTAPHKIPDTIRSRCQRHHFKRLEVAEISTLLEKICKAEKVKFESEALRLLSRKAEGSLRDAESLLDQCITASSGEVATTSVRDILGLLDHEMVMDFLGAIGSREPTSVLQRLDDAIRKGVDLDELLNALIEGHRDLMLLKSSDDLAELIFRSEDELGALRKVLPSYELADLVMSVERLCNVAPRMKIASDPRILLESTLVDLALLDRQTEIREVLGRLERSGGTGALPADGRAKKTKPATDRKASPPAGTASIVQSAAGFGAVPVSAREPQRSDSGHDDVAGPDVNFASLDYASVRKLWDGFVTYVRQKKVSLGVCLISGTVQSIDGKTVTLRFGKKFGYQRGQVEDAANKKFLKNTMSRYFGHDLELVCFSEGEQGVAARGRSNLNGDDETTAPKREIESQPIVKKILDDFDGEIIRYHPQ